MKGIEKNICDLPDLALNGIAEYLEPKDIIHLSESTPYFEDLRRFLPKYQDISGQDFHKRGPYDGDFVPETYFDGPEMNQGAKSLKMNLQWKDQVIQMSFCLMCFNLMNFRAMETERGKCGSS